MDSIFESGLSLALSIVPLIVPFILWQLFFDSWVEYVRRRGFAKQDYILLEVRIPKEIEQTPASMELVLQGLHQTGGEGNWYAKYWEGKTRPWFSLEIASFGGEVRFHVWTRKAWRPHVERSIYAQYPSVEIAQVEDYTFGHKYDPTTMEAWGCTFGLTKADAYPIKTYTEYGDSIDPLNGLIEFMGSINSGEQIWLQIVIRGHKESPDPWKKNAEEEAKKIMDKAKKNEMPMTKEEQEAVTALRRSTSKDGFDVGIRAIYFGDKSSYNGMNVSGLTGCLKQFNSNTLNGFKPTGGLTSLSYPWQDIGKKKSTSMKKGLFSKYKQRGFFYPPAEAGFFVLNTEELATIYHFPNASVQTPTLKRIQSRKAEAPSNLPI